MCPSTTGVGGGTQVCPSTAGVVAHRCVHQPQGWWYTCVSINHRGGWWYTSLSILVPHCSCVHQPIKGLPARGVNQPRTADILCLRSLAQVDLTKESWRQLVPQPQQCAGIYLKLIDAANVFNMRCAPRWPRREVNWCDIGPH